MADDSYQLSLAPAARRAITEGPPTGLPVAVATAVAEFITGLLLEKPRVVGKPLTNELTSYHSARRGSYRVIYRINDDALAVHVVRIDHRAPGPGYRSSPSARAQLRASLRS